ncbi:pilus assembly protein [Thermophilibacter sp.]
MSVEAAVLLPVALTLVALLVQPVCVLYTRAVMASTAGELARLAATSRGDEHDLRAFALRRLAAVPEVSVFHVGGADGWDVEVEGPGEEGVVTVALAGRVRPLPVLGVLASALGEVEGNDVVLRVETSASVRADWIGGSYGDWVGIWS